MICFSLKKGFDVPTQLLDFALLAILYSTSLSHLSTDYFRNVGQNLRDTDFNKLVQEFQQINLIDQLEKKDNSILNEKNAQALVRLKEMLFNNLIVMQETKDKFRMLLVLLQGRQLQEQCDVMTFIRLCIEAVTISFELHNRTIFIRSSEDGTLKLKMVQINKERKTGNEFPLLIYQDEKMHKFIICPVYKNSPFDNISQGQSDSATFNMLLDADNEPDRDTTPKKKLKAGANNSEMDLSQKRAVETVLNRNANRPVNANTSQNQLSQSRDQASSIRLHHLDTHKTVEIDRFNKQNVSTDIKTNSFLNLITSTSPDKKDGPPKPNSIFTSIPINQISSTPSSIINPPSLSPKPAATARETAKNDASHFQPVTKSNPNLPFIPPMQVPNILNQTPQQAPGDLSPAPPHLQKTTESSFKKVVMTNEEFTKFNTTQELKRQVSPPVRIGITEAASNRNLVDEPKTNFMNHIFSPLGNPGAAQGE